MVLILFFFFFQAEDGIRDYKVTGVQTCALPIFGWTYYLIADGAISFLVGVPDPPVWVRLLVTAGAAGLLSLYGYYMGRSRWQEETLHVTIPASLLRCPFISSILASKKA